MTRTVLTGLTLTLLASGFAGPAALAADLSPGQQLIETAAQNGQFAFIMFYRTNDAATRGMRQVLQTTLSQREDATIVPVQISDATEAALVERFDASRMPMPAVAAIAPNGAVTGVFPQRVSSQHLTTAIVSPGQAECLGALQGRKIVLLCVQPQADATIPTGVREFEADALYENRTQVVTIQANDPAEAKFLEQLRVRSDQQTSVVAFMAPPGVMLGVFDANVTLDVLAQKLSAAGKCCDDENCKHRQATGGRQPARR